MGVFFVLVSMISLIAIFSPHWFDEPPIRLAVATGICCQLLFFAGCLVASLRERGISSRTLSRELDEWGERVKNLFMELGGQFPVSEPNQSDHDQLLKPLDRQRFIRTMSGRLEESLGFIADTMAEGRTDYELLCNQKKIEPFLANMSWEAIATALEMRQIEGEPVSVDSARCRAESLPTRWLPDKPSTPRPTDSWAKKYRRMTAQGI
jgi:hypothetical protein